MKKTMNGIYTKNEEMYNFNFYTDLSASDKLSFVNSVSYVLVGEQKYDSIIRDLITDFYIVDIFSDIDTSELSKSDYFIDDVEQFLEETNIVSIIKANMKDGLLDELNKAIDYNVECRTGIRFNPINEAIAKLVNSIEKKINDVDLNDAINMAQKFAAMTEEFTPENIVNAYVNSDMHKQNLEEIAEFKK